LTISRNHLRSSRASAVHSPFLKLPFFLPLGAPGLRPPCNRHRLRPSTAGDGQGPERVRAPHRFCNTCHPDEGIMGLTSEIATPPSSLPFTGYEVVSLPRLPIEISGLSMRSHANTAISRSYNCVPRLTSSRIGMRGCALSICPAVASESVPRVKTNRIRRPSSKSLRTASSSLGWSRSRESSPATPAV
jgi:hypothetical protein